MQNHKTKFGLVGIGGHATENLIPAIQNVDEVEIYGISSRDPEKAESLKVLYKAQEAYSQNDVFEDKVVDGIIVSATPEIHEEMLNKALALNKNIFVEKPPFRNLEKFNKFLEIFEKLNLKPVIQFGFNFRHSDFYKKLEELTGNFANTKFMKIRSYSSKPTEPMWGYEDVFSSSLYAIHIHAIEMLCYTLGEIETINSNIQWLNKDKYICNVIIKFKGGKTGILELSNNSNRFEFDVEVSEEDLNVKVEGFNKFWLSGKKFSYEGLFKNKEQVYFEIPFLKGGFDRTGYSNQFRKFANDISNKEIDMRSINSCQQTYILINKLTNHE